MLNRLPGRRLAVLGALACSLDAGPAWGEAAKGAARPQAPSKAAGSIEVGVEGAALGGTYLRVAVDLANALNGPGLRVVPVVGQGSLQNLHDLLGLRGVDVAVVQSDVLAYARQERLLPPGGEAAIQYVAPLYGEEVHVLARPEIRSVADLAGKTINADLPRSGSAMTMRVLFSALGIPVSFTDDPQDVAIEKLKRGEIAATIRVGAKPMAMFSSLPPDLGLHLLAFPQAPALLRTYTPASLSHADYPHLIPAGGSVDTLSTQAVLAVYAWPRGTVRHRQVSAFVSALFRDFERLLQPPAHPKWREVNLFAQVPGWKRFEAAEREVLAAQVQSDRGESDRFLDATKGAPKAR